MSLLCFIRGFIWPFANYFVPLHRFRAIAVKEELLDMLRSNDEQLK
jgi:hypothetical protein